MTAAVAAGADAVYIGGNRFGARAYADNLDEEKMLEAIEYMHLHGGRLYMTVNTLMKDGEMDELYDYLNPYYRQGLDAAIVQDLGVFSFLREHFPGLHLHASTQMTVTGVYGARLLKDLGAERVVTARELSLEEISRIRRNVDVEIESFVHGALCYCYSGQCLLSSVIGGRSGNRGRCAQPCRLPYDVKRGGKEIGKRDERYVMSLKDLCTLDLIPDMIEAGIDSMKIEGRMKSPRYTAGVVSIYRKYVDSYLKDGRDGYRVDPADKKCLLDLFDRGGFTEGYYRKHNGRDMVALHEKPQFREINQKLFDELDEKYVNSHVQRMVFGKAVLKEGEPSSLTLSSGSTSVTVYGKVSETAQNQPITEEKLLRQMKKTGGTQFAFERLEGEVAGRPFVPVQELNELRRRGFEYLEKEILKPFHREDGRKPLKDDFTSSDWKNGAGPGTVKITASAEQKKTAERLAGTDGISRIYLDSNTIDADQWKELCGLCHKNKKECYLMLPQIFRTEAESYFIKHKSTLKEAGFDGVLLRSMEEVGFLNNQEVRLPMMFDSCLYIFNRKAEMVMRDIGASALTLPAELNEKELKNLDCSGKELIAYGYLPLMVSAQCVKKTVDGCSKKPEILYMKDRMGKEFPVRNHCRFCYNTIYNMNPLSLHGQESRIRALGPDSIRLSFTIETEEESAEIAEAFVRGYEQGSEIRLPVREFTRGHFKRGVE
ncbi:U32 family peptidase [Clostridium sp. AM58-1XD]|nr:U32 family peptidase [Clostridium sp. AM58-1XD]